MSNWIYVATTVGLAAVAWWVIHCDVRSTVRQAADLRTAGQLQAAIGPGSDLDQALAASQSWPAATALDAGMERIVTRAAAVLEAPVGSLHGCGCFVQYLPSGDCRISPCPPHEERGDWIGWERQMRENSK